MSYYIIRYFRDERPPRLVRRVPSLLMAQEHCNDPKTKEEGKWFDGYTDTLPMNLQN